MTQFNRNYFIVCFSLTITKDGVREPQIANHCNWATSVLHKKLDSVLKDTSLPDMTEDMRRKFTYL